MRKLRVLVLMDKDFVPPDNLEGHQNLGVRGGERAGLRLRLLRPVHVGRHGGGRRGADRDGHELLPQ